MALGPHAAKSALRAASSATTAGIANPLVSFVEDALAIGLFIAVVILPVISVAVLATVIWLLVRRRRKAAPAAA